MDTVLLLFLLVFIYLLYSCFIILKFGFDYMFDSLSNSYYKLEYWKPGWGILFTIFCFTEAYLAAILMLEVTDGEWYQFLCFFAAAGLLLIGAAPRFKDYEKTIHYVGLLISVISVIIWTVLSGYFWLFIILTLVNLFVYFICGQMGLLFWMENIFFTTVFIVIAKLFKKKK